MEDYSHKDIAEALNISENTSKTQLLKARRLLKNKVVDYHKTRVIPHYQ
jgi:RNA polymerase sigma-70 factor (ECF subfamily)